MNPEIALQTALRARLVSTAAVVALVPASAILDRNEQPAPDPSVIIGEGQSVDEGNSIARDLVRVYMDVQVWKREPSTAGVKAIAGAIRAALKARLVLTNGFHCADSLVRSMRFLRDPDGLTSHAVITVSALVEEIG